MTDFLLQESGSRLLQEIGDKLILDTTTVTGTGAATFGLTAVAAGSSTTGTHAATTLGITGSATGSRGASGTAAATLGLAGAATGAVAATGAGLVDVIDGLNAAVKPKRKWWRF